MPPLTPPARPARGEAAHQRPGSRCGPGGWRALMSLALLVSCVDLGRPNGTGTVTPDDGPDRPDLRPDGPGPGAEVSAEGPPEPDAPTVDATESDSPGPDGPALDGPGPDAPVVDSAPEAPRLDTAPPDQPPLGNGQPCAAGP